MTLLVSEAFFNTMHCEAKRRGVSLAQLVRARCMHGEALAEFELPVLPAHATEEDELVGLTQLVAQELAQARQMLAEGRHELAAAVAALRRSQPAPAVAA